MNTNSATSKLGLILLSFLFAGSMNLAAQGIKGITNKVKDAGNKVTQPVKDVRTTVKDVSQAPRDLQNAKRDVTQPVRDMQREVDGLKNDTQQAKRDYENLAGGGNGRNNNSRDSKEEKARQDSVAKAKAATDAAAKADAEAKEKARVDSVYNSKLRTGTVIIEQADPPATETSSASVEPSRTVLLPPSTIKTTPPNANRPTTRTRTRTRTRTATGASAAGSSPASAASSNTRPATTTRSSVPMRSSNSLYTNSPARRYLERSDFDMETLDDLFKAAIWTGPDSLHTARSIDYMLQQYRMDIDEVKRLDPNWDITGHEDRYTRWKGLYYRNTRPLKED